MEIIALNTPSAFEIGASDHHHLIYSMLKTPFKKEEPKLYKYQEYKKFDSTAFHMDLQNKLDESSKFESPKIYQDLKRFL